MVRPKEWGNARKYPWEEWLSRARTVLLRGVHYRCSQSTMVQTIRNNASRRKVLVSINDTDTEIVIEVKSASRDIDGQVVPNL